MDALIAKKKITLFIPCLVDTVWPHVAEAMVAVLQGLRLDLDCPADQTCCGQPALHSGYHREARTAARRFIEIFAKAEIIVSPSGSCVHMVRHHYPELFAAEPDWLIRATEVAGKTYEFTEFLVDILKIDDLGASYPSRATYHDTCTLLRGLNIREQPRRLLAKVKGLELVEMKNSDYCCGFGGSFAAEYSDISTAMVYDKVDNIVNTGADTVVGCDTGCLLNIDGAISRRGLKIKAKHIAEILASRQ